MFLPCSQRCPGTLRKEIIKQILTRYDFTTGRIYLPSAKDHECLQMLITHPHVNQINPPIGQHLSNLLKTHSSKTILPLIGTLLSRNDYNIKQIADPNILIQPYLDFYRLKQSILTKRRQRTLPVAKTRTLWQRIAHNLQHPPLEEKNLYVLQGYGRLIGCAPRSSPIQICVALAQHYDTYVKTLTYNHQLQTANETDLYGTPFKELPLEYIIKDDTNYGFNIAEINQIKKLTRHPYIGVEWSQVTVNQTPIFEHKINPIHLMHQMAESFDAVDAVDHQIQRLMSVYGHLTYPICLVYVDHQQCRNKLLRHLRLLTLNDPTFDEFCDILTRPLGINLHRIYNEFELCQIYA
jgi:hypothetical protein